MARAQLEGFKTGLLTVLSYYDTVSRDQSKAYARWLCQCKCGNTCVKNTDYLKHLVFVGDRSCGCLHKSTIFDKKRYGKDYHERAKASGMYWKGYLKRMYSITPDRYDKILFEQDGRCAICFQCPSVNKRLIIDHDHSCCLGTKSCGKCVRGLLCGFCNRTLGQAKENIDTLKNAIKYVEKWKPESAGI